MGLSSIPVYEVVLPAEDAPVVAPPPFVQYAPTGVGFNTYVPQGQAQAPPGMTTPLGVGTSSPTASPPATTVQGPNGEQVPLVPYAGPIGVPTPTPTVLEEAIGVPTLQLTRVLLPGFLSDVVFTPVLAPPPGVYVEGQPYVPAGRPFLEHLTPVGMAPPQITEDRVVPYGYETVVGALFEGTDGVFGLDLDRIKTELDRKRAQTPRRGNTSMPGELPSNPTPLESYLRTGEVSHLWAYYRKIPFLPSEDGRYSLMQRAYGLPYIPEFGETTT